MRRFGAAVWRPDQLGESLLGEDTPHGLGETELLGIEPVNLQIHPYFACFTTDTTEQIFSAGRREHFVRSYRITISIGAITAILNAIFYRYIISTNDYIEDIVVSVCWALTVPFASRLPDFFLCWMVPVLLVAALSVNLVLSVRTVGETFVRNNWPRGFAN